MATNEQNVTSEDAEEVERAPRWLIATVVILGIAIIGMIVLIVGKIIVGNGGDAATTDAAGVIDQTASSQVIAGLSTSYLKDVSIMRPEGGVLEKVEVSGQELVMHFRLTDGGDMIIMLNRINGKTSRILVP